MAALRCLALGAVASAAGAVMVEVTGTQEQALAMLAGTRAQVQDDVATTHNLTVCNAYADHKPLSVYTVTNKAKLTEEPLQYKACKQISLELAEGERIDFKLGGLSVGTFRVTGLPYVSANLLLVPYHRSNDTMSAAFASHMFSAADEKAQVAVIDAYSGSEAGLMKLHRRAVGPQTATWAKLKHGSSIKVNAGSYHVSLSDAHGKSIKTVKLDATSSARYVVIRVGSESDGHAQELVVSSATGTEGIGAAGSGSFRAGLGIFAAVAAVAFSLAASVA
jgi:hypothetical protein